MNMKDKLSKNMKTKHQKLLKILKFYKLNFHYFSTLNFKIKINIHLNKE